MRGKMTLFILIAIMLFGLCGCMSKEDDEQLKKITKEALAYIEEKYQENFSVKGSDYVLIDTTLFPTYADDIKIFLEDGTRILYVAEEDKFYDDYQTEEICNTLEEKIFNPILEQLSPYCFEPTGYETVANFNYYNEEGYHGNFFHMYYDGDIEEFCAMEKPSFDLGYFDDNNNWNQVPIFLLTEEKEEWEARVNIIRNTLGEYCGEGVGREFRFVALTQKLYERKLEEDVMVNIGMEGCWAMGTITEMEIQNFIKIANGIYATSADENFVLEEGDITLREIMSPQELQEIMDEAAMEIKEEDCRYVVNSLTPVYEPVFSERIQERYKQYGDDASIYLYIRLKPEELGVSNENNLYNYPIRYGKVTYCENYTCAQGDGQDGELDHWYIFKKDHKDYYWIGVQTKEEVVE